MKFVLLISVLALASCGISGTVNLPPPDRLGGGTLPITILPEK